MNSMKTSSAGIALIIESEDFRATPYLCEARLWNIGFGHRIESKDDYPFPITYTRAQELLAQDLEYFERAVNRLVMVPLTQPQFDALVSLTYNIGPDENHNGKAEGLGESTLLALLNQGDYLGAAEQFLVWHHVHHKDSEGLKKRREKERALFLSGTNQ